MVSSKPRAPSARVSDESFGSRNYGRKLRLWEDREDFGRSHSKGRRSIGQDRCSSRRLAAPHNKRKISSRQGNLRRRSAAKDRRGVFPNSGNWSFRGRPGGADRTSQGHAGRPGHRRGLHSAYGPDARKHAAPAACQVHLHAGAGSHRRNEGRGEPSLHHSAQCRPDNRRRISATLGAEGRHRKNSADRRLLLRPGRRPKKRCHWRDSVWNGLGRHAGFEGDQSRRRHHVRAGLEIRPISRHASQRGGRRLRRFHFAPGQDCRRAFANGPPPLHPRVQRGRAAAGGGGTRRKPS